MPASINKDTQLCISIASRPSNFGTTIHNAAFQALSLNFIYKACGVRDIAGAMAGVRALGIRGCGVSMPFKETVIPYLDALDPVAEAIGAVNTVVNDDGRLTGSNTDAIGARALLSEVGLPPGERVTILGAGGVAKAILWALRDLGVSTVCVAARTTERARALARIHPCEVIDWPRRGDAAAGTLINATPIGMTPDIETSPLDSAVVPRFAKVIDVVVMPFETALLRVARAAGLGVGYGYRMSLFQAAAQFELYTGQKAPFAVMEQALRAMVAPR
jgi:shikimate dehydrogenase